MLYIIILAPTNVEIHKIQRKIPDNKFSPDFGFGCVVEDWVWGEAVVPLALACFCCSGAPERKEHIILYTDGQLEHPG